MQTRPLWRRAGGRVRRGLYRAYSVIDRLVPSRRDSLLPPAHLRVYYYRSTAPSAFFAACEAARAEVMTHGLKPADRVLDIGSGIGNLALGLKDFLTGPYVGLEIHAEALAWCQHHITPRYPAFTFRRADVASRAYNAGGTSQASSYRFPFENGVFDFVMLGSVFTHMLPDEVANYLREIARVLAPTGVAVMSAFVLDDESRPCVAAGRSFMSFDVTHASGLCRLHDAAVPEAAVALEESFVRSAIADAGLHLRARRRGGWFTGRAHDQDVLTVSRGDR